MLERYTSIAIAGLAKQTVRKPDFRRGLLESAHKPDEFIGFVESAMRSASGGEIVDGDQQMKLPEFPFCEREFANLPPDTMRDMAALWSDMEKRDASEPGVWARVNLRMVESGKVKPEFFAAGLNGGDSAKGLHRIQHALQSQNEQAITNCARLIVRSFAGCPQIRGIRTLYQDCSPARAWWVCRLASEAAQELAQTDEERTQLFESALDILQRRLVWENLSERIVSRLTVLGDIKVRNGIILFLAEMREDGDASRFLKGEDLKRLFRRIGQMCAWRALGYFESAGVSGIIRDEIVPTILPKK